MFALNPDRIMIYYDHAESNWITLRVALFHYTLFKTDILDILDILDMEIPPWLEAVIKYAQRLESRPIPEAPFPQSLPTWQTIKNIIPKVIEPGMAYPTWSGTQMAGLVINPGGDVEMTEIPFRAKLRTATYLGLNWWLQSGMLNGATCFVSQSLLHYQRATEARAMYPGLDISGYIEGMPGIGEKFWHVPGLADTDAHASETIYAHNEIYYQSGSYIVDRYFFGDCPAPEYPEGHFLRPVPGMKCKISAVRGTLGRWRLLIEDDFQQGDNLDSIPYGCQPGWPTDDYLDAYGLYNDDSVGIHSFSSVLCKPVPGYIWPHAITEAAGFGAVVIEEEETEDVRLGGNDLPGLSLALMLLRRNGYSLARVDGWESKANTTEGQTDSTAGKTEEE